MINKINNDTKTINFHDFWLNILLEKLIFKNISEYFCSINYAEYRVGFGGNFGAGGIYYIFSEISSQVNFLLLISIHTWHAHNFCTFYPPFNYYFQHDFHFFSFSWVCGGDVFLLLLFPIIIVTNCQISP